MQSCQQTYNNAVVQCGCGGSGSAGGGGNACTSCTNSALQQLTACVKAANQQFQQHKSAAAATQLQTDLEACDANYEKAINACSCHSSSKIRASVSVSVVRTPESRISDQRSYRNSQ